MKVVGLFVLFITLDTLSVQAKLNSSEPGDTDVSCPPDEEYRSCERCNKTCENPNPTCPEQCNKGCFCRNDLVRNKNGVCVRLEECTSSKNFSSNLVKPVMLQLTCGPHQTYSHCKSCEQVCNTHLPVCRSPCSAGCFCDDGYLKAPSGQCVKLEECPKAEVSFGDAQESSIEDCSSDEIYLTCGWCEPTCREPNPQCPPRVCHRGCLCRPPLVRHHNGNCVPRRDCAPQKCPDPNEEFVCRYGWCEARCDSYKCDARPRRCILGCYCKLGLFRDSKGKCVSLLECPEYNATNPRSDKDSDTNIFHMLNQINDSVITFNITDSSEEKLFDEVPIISLGVPFFSTLTLSDDKGPKSVFDLPLATPYNNNKHMKSKKAIADTRNPSYRPTVGNTVFQLPSEVDHVDMTISHDRKQPRTILSMLKAGQFVIDNKPAELKGETMNDFIMKTLSRVIPQGAPINVTIVNYSPLWTPIEPVGH